ncbi:TetR/AcrR family transcriptional regulator [Actinocorallia sp. B10E7]|uniref:TetR/AcrR family transcriptional regulator n=1 Tax=Actinocorallia sp. B10E7 TaxID=3153558 RepID=UPI00325D6C37
MTISDSGSENTRDHILDVATRLFSRLGYDAITVRMIADSAGLDVATVTDQVGGKRELYIAVLERITGIEYDFLQQKVAEAEPGMAGMILLTDAYLDFCVEHPEVPALWMHRWLSDAADITELEERFSGKIQSLLLGAVSKAIGEGEAYEGEPPFDLELVGWTTVWCIHGFVQGGFMDEKGRTRRPQDPKALRRVRKHLHELVERMLGMYA